MNYKLNQELVDKLAKGEIAIDNTGNPNVDILRHLLRTAFPKDGIESTGRSRYYYQNDQCNEKWYTENENTINLPTIPLSDFILKDREIVGYKLITPEYEKAAIQIAYINPDEIPNFSCYPKFNNGSFSPDSGCAERLRKAGVLDLWFEPVYKEDDKPKEIENLPLTLEVYRAKFRLIQIITQDLIPHAKLKELITEYSKQ